MTNSSSAGSAGSPLLAITFLIFLVLKLTGVIGWSWWWVTAPLWGPIAVVTVVIVAVLLDDLGKGFRR